MAIKRRKKAAKKHCKCGTVKGRPSKCRKAKKNGSCPKRRRSVKRRRK